VKIKPEWSATCNAVFKVIRSNTETNETCWYLFHYWYLQLNTSGVSECRWQLWYSETTDWILFKI